MEFRTLKKSEIRARIQYLRQLEETEFNFNRRRFIEFYCRFLKLQLMKGGETR